MEQAFPARLHILLARKKPYGVYYLRLQRDGWTLKHEENQGKKKDEKHN